METLDSGTLGQRDWLLLLDEIKARRVIPILGEKVFSIKEGDNKYPVKEYLLSKF